MRRVKAIRFGSRGTPLQLSVRCFSLSVLFFSRCGALPSCPQRMRTLCPGRGWRSGLAVGGESAVGGGCCFCRSTLATLSRHQAAGTLRLLCSLPGHQFQLKSTERLCVCGGKATCRDFLTLTGDSRTHPEGQTTLGFLHESVSELRISPEERAPATVRWMDGRLKSSRKQPDERLNGCKRACRFLNEPAGAVPVKTHPNG